MSWSCATCSAVNEAGAQNCVSCRRPLSWTCLRCSGSNANANRFCVQCGLLNSAVDTIDPPLSGLSLATRWKASAPVWAWDWQPNGSAIAAIVGLAKNRRLITWDGVNQAEEVKEVGAATCVTWSSHGWLATAGNSQPLGIVRRSTAPDATFTDIYANSLAYAPLGDLIAVAGDEYLGIFDPHTKTFVFGAASRVPIKLEAHRQSSLAWSPDGTHLAVAHGSRILVYSFGDGRSSPRLEPVLESHRDVVRMLSWAVDGQTLASASRDGTVLVWNVATRQILAVLEEPSGTVEAVAFSSGGGLLASRGKHGVRLWRTDGYELVATIPEECPLGLDIGSPTLAFDPLSGRLATWTTLAGSGLRLWSIDEKQVLGSSADRLPQYVNAKVVLIGDSGVGKSGLALVLSGESFVPTESTHGRRVWTFSHEQIEVAQGGHEVQEALLWDLAGQPGYRLVHQLHLSEVAVAVVVFDARSETDPLAGVRHWDRAVRQAQRLQPAVSLAGRKFLVAARADRGGPSISKKRIDALLTEYGFDAFFETSAKENWKVADLRQAISRSIPWDTLPRVSSTELFQAMKTFLVSEKESGRILARTSDLMARFMEAKVSPLPNEPSRTQDRLTPSDGRREGTGADMLRRHAGRDFNRTEPLKNAFDTCIGRVESRGLIRKLSFGGLVLLQPELLDAYASGIVNSAKGEPDGLGSISEEVVLSAQFALPADERLRNQEEERLLLLATVEDLVRFEIALKEQASDGTYLVFPSQLTRERPELPEPSAATVVLEFEGPVSSVYSTLVVRLSHSGRFRKTELWRNSVEYEAVSGGKCSIVMREAGEGRALLSLFFDEHASDETRHQFEKYITSHLDNRALPGTQKQRRTIVCPQCRTPITDFQAEQRRKRGHEVMNCNVCESEVSLIDRKPPLSESRAVSLINHEADAKRNQNAAEYIIQGKRRTGSYDVFLSYNASDRRAIKDIAEGLLARGILTWLDQWNLRPGLPWQTVLEAEIKKINAAAVFVGSSGIGPWQESEVAAFIRQFMKRGCPVIPVLLKDAPTLPILPVFLEGMTWVDFRVSDPDPMDQLVWGVTGKR
jgi:WD40 repeat protein